MGCGTAAQVAPPGDVRICNGQMFESLDDGHGVVNLDTYPKQPFDFSARTGKVVFDVSADSDGSHGAWPEFVITDKPVPGTRGLISQCCPASALNEIGFALDGGTIGGDGTMTGVGQVFITRNGVYSEGNYTATGHVRKAVPGGPLNHFEVRVSQNHLEVWGTDPGSTVLKQLAVADNIALTFTRGLVWLNDVHYNARKAIEPCECGTQWEHTFVWDNLGFDGPKTYRDLGYDVPDANIRNGQTTQLGYLIGTTPRTFTLNGVKADQTPTGAQVVLNTYAFAETLPSVSINGGPWIDTPWTPQNQTYAWLSLSIPVPLNQIKDGTNTLTFKSGDWSTTIANISLILVAAAPVP